MSLKQTIAAENDWHLYRDLADGTLRLRLSVGRTASVLSGAVVVTLSSELLRALESPLKAHEVDE